MITPQYFFRTKGANDSGEHDRYILALGNDLELHVAAYSHVGIKRKHNEDNYLLRDGLLVVCDGMGGHEAGEVASEIACTYFGEHNNPEITLTELAEGAHNAIRAEVDKDPSKHGMGTTLVAARFTETGQLNFTTVGDSRLYQFSLDDRVLQQLTVDHSLVQDLYEAGRIKKEDMRTHKVKNILTLSLGVEETLDTDKIKEYPIDCVAGNVSLLCSDGLLVLDDTQIAQIMDQTYAAHPDDDLAVAQALVAAANAAGGPDNITVVLARVRAYSQEEIIKNKVAAGVEKVMDRLHREGIIYTVDETARMVAEARRDEAVEIAQEPTRILDTLRENARNIANLLTTSYSTATDQTLLRQDAAKFTTFVAGIEDIYKILIRSYATVVEKALGEKDLVSVREFLEQLHMLTRSPIDITEAPEETLPSIPHLYYKAAQLHFDVGETDSVSALLDRLEKMRGIKEERLLGSMYLLRAKTALSQRRTSEALDALEKSSAAGEAQHIYNRAGIDELPVLYDNIISNHHQAVMARTNDTVAYTETVRALFSKTGDKPEGTALDYLKYTLYQGQRTGASTALTELGMMYYLDRKLPAAEIVLAKLVEDNTQDSFVYNTLAQVVRQGNNTKDPAREEWTKWLTWKAEELEKTQQK
ncbi:MAG: protein phosphatase 2C domain-containing protein [Nanoarchaeota archaeon]